MKNKRSVSSITSLKERVSKKISNQHEEIKKFDMIVVGVGSMGSAACYHLAKQGYAVLGIDQYAIPHENGSHSGQTRIIRKAYFEHPDYVPLLDVAYQNWDKIEDTSGEQLFFKTGLLYCGSSANDLISGVRDSAEKYHLSLEELENHQFQERFPQFDIPLSYDRLFESGAGFITPERAILVYIEQALNNGAVIKTGEKVLSYSEQTGGIHVETSHQTYECGKLIITTGAWTGQLLPQMKSKLEVTRQMIAWVKPKMWEPFELGKLPCWMVAHPDGKGLYYGFPILPTSQFGAPAGMKVAYHYPGDLTHPDMVNRETNYEEEQMLSAALKELIPDGFEAVLITKTCLYTNSVDGHFILDTHPENKDVILGTGFSGHGFKFSSVIGEILAELATKGNSRLPIGFLGFDRFS